MKKVMAVLNLSVLAVLFVFLSTSGGRGAFGAIFCVTNPTELQNALNTAASNGQDDTIQVVQGTYRGNFIYFLDKNFKLTLQGGFTPGCTDRVVDPSNTILDGDGGSDVIFILDTQIPLIRKRGHITIGGFTVRNGGTAGIRAGGTRSITITNNIVSNNSSHGGVFAVRSNSITLTNNIIRDNTSSNGFGGGGVFAQDGGSITLTNNTISGNKGGIGGGHGGGVFATGNLITLTNNIIRGNTISSSGTFATGGGVFVEGSPIILTNNTISGNKSVGFGAGGGLFINSLGIAADVYNNIIFGNTADWWGDDIFIDSNAINICYNDFTDLVWWSDELPPQNSGVGCGDVPNSGNITADPLFVNPVGGDFHIRGSSPCINAGFNVAPGIPPHDKDGFPRVMGANVDMGAFESVGEVCNDGVDNDGDGLADCDDPDCEAKPVCLCRCPINILPAGCISGAVTNEGTGNPLAGKTVILRRISPRKPIVRLNTVTDDGGCYQFGNLEEGTYRANVRRCRGGGTKTIVITTGRTVNNMNFECR